MGVLDLHNTINAAVAATAAAAPPPTSSSSSSSSSSLRMSARLFRSRVFVLVALAFVAATFWLTYGPESPAYHGSSNHAPARPPVEATLGSWRFVAHRDRNDHSLTSAQCHNAFPKLYHEIRRAEEYWLDRQGHTKISEEQISLDWSPDGGLRAMIYDNQLYVVGSRGLNHFGHWMERSQATLHQIHRAMLASQEPVPNIEFSIKINDKYDFHENHPKTENSTLWVFSRDINDEINQAVWIIPDFNFWAYPRVSGAFGEFQRQAIGTLGDKFESKYDKLVWRGTTAFNPDIREALLQQVRDKPWSAVHKVAEDSSHPEDIQYKISLPEHCKYKFAVHTEGTTWSGRLKYLLSCHSVIFIHPLRYYTHLYHLLDPSGPNQNYVESKMDWSDLPARMEDFLEHPEQGRAIADNAASTFRDRYATPAAQSCYWRELFRTWSNMAFEPDPYESVTGADGRPERRIRGMTYEDYIFHKADVPIPDDQKH